MEGDNVVVLSAIGFLYGNCKRRVILFECFAEAPCPNDNLLAVLFASACISTICSFLGF